MSTTATLETTSPASVYDYTHHYLLRTDPTCPPAPTAGTDPADTSIEQAETGAFAGTLPYITAIWAQVSPDLDALAAMNAVLHAFTDHAQKYGYYSWHNLPAAVIDAFVHQRDSRLDDTGRRLRKNTVHAGYLALIDANLHPPHSPATGIDPNPRELRHDARGQHRGNPTPAKTRRRYDQRVHVRAASHDEITLIRLASRLAGSSRSQQLPSAAVAICCASATTAEAPQVRWQDLNGDTVQLPGRTADPGREETAVSPRTATLDPWSLEALTALRREKGSVRTVQATDSVLYAGAQHLTSDSAQVSTDQQIRKALTIADLRREPGLSAGSLRLWAAAKHVHDYTTLPDGATVAGVHPFTLHRQINHLSERAL